jgi:hypothetical protein
VQLGVLALYDLVFLLSCLLLACLALGDASDNSFFKVL